ncbi:RNA polymerase sigma factor [Alishewanella sp. d11]|uniref:RNA polymerase sigma factor n=1 Tax=Alishewanella sp. d11 TaxID=3414030 RepID=UPI003BF91E81
MNEWPALLQRAQLGDKQAYQRFLTEALPFLRSRARRYVSAQQVEDLVQDVLLTVHRILHSYQYDLPVEPWLSGILRHKYYESWRELAKGTWQPLAEDDSWHPVADFAEESQADAVTRVLAPLNAEQAQALFATKVAELSVQETANLMQRSVAWVKVNVHRAIVLLRTELTEEP